MEIFATRKEVFSMKLQEIELFSEYLEAVAKMKSDFAWKVKKRGN